jgi:hypothetical protein
LALSTADNARMEILGRVHNGVVVLEGARELPEGAVVAVTYPARKAACAPTERKRVEFPLVRSARPGSVRLTGRRIAEILDDEDAAL